MLLIGILLVVLGVVSLIVAPTNVDFLSWVDDLQPALGIVLAVLGFGLMAAAFFKKRAAEQPPGTPVSGGSPTGERSTAGRSAAGQPRAGVGNDVEPTGLGSGPTSRDPYVGRGSVPTGGQHGVVPPGGRTGPGPVGGEYREPIPGAADPQHPGPQQRPNPAAADARRTPDAPAETVGRPVQGSPTAHDVGTAGPHHGKSSQPHGGHQEAAMPGPSRADKAQPKRPGPVHPGQPGDAERLESDSAQPRHDEKGL